MPARRLSLTGPAPAAISGRPALREPTPRLQDANALAAAGLAAAAAYFQETQRHDDDEWPAPPPAAAVGPGRRILSRAPSREFG